MRFKKHLFFLPLLVVLACWTHLPMAQAKAIEGVVNINTATPAELMLLPGIGKAKAEQIVQLRQSKPFASLDDLKGIKGLGAKRLEAMRPHVVVNGPTTAKKVAAPKVEVKPATPGSPKI